MSIEGIGRVNAEKLAKAYGNRHTDLTTGMALEITPEIY